MISSVRRAFVLATCLSALGTAAWAQGGAPRVRLQTSAGDIVIELYPDKAPKTVANFLQYVSEKHYDNTIFHRVIDNFMVQGGGFDTNYAERKTRPPIAHEGREALAKGLKNVVGTVAMARTSDPNSASSQFFINVKDNDFLNHQNESAQGFGYAVFGKVVEGMDVVDRIRSVQTGNKAGHGDVPLQPVVINSATVKNE